MAAPTVFHTLDNTYTVYSHHKNTMGHGAFGVVYQGFDRYNRTIAAKCLSNFNDPHADALVSDANQLRNLEHNNIVKIFNIERIRDTLWVVLEHYTNGNLNQFFLKTNLTLNQKLDIMLDISQGLEFLHERNLIHRSIKPQNILIADDSYTAKLTDYEIVRIFDPSIETAMVTAKSDTLVFKAPEHFLRGDKNVYGQHTDIFGAALTFLAMLQYKPGSALLIPHHEALSSKTQLYVLSIGQLMADRMVNKGLTLNVVLDRENEAVAASVVAAVVTVAAVFPSALLSKSEPFGFMTPVVASAVAVVTTVFSATKMFGFRAAKKLVAVLLGWCTVALILSRHSNILIDHSSFNSFFQNETISAFSTIGSVLAGVGITFGSRFLGVPLHEAVTTNQWSLWSLPALGLASLGSFACSALFSSLAASPTVEYGRSFGALAGCLGACAISSNPLSVLVGAGVLGAAFKSDTIPLIPNFLSGCLFAGYSWLVGNKLPSFANLSYSKREIARTLAYLISPALAVGISCTLGYEDLGSALGVLGAAAGATLGFGAAGLGLPGLLTNAGDPFVQSDKNNGQQARRKRAEIRHLIGQMTSFEGRQRLTSCDVTKQLRNIRTLPS